MRFGTSRITLSTSHTCICSLPGRTFPWTRHRGYYQSLRRQEPRSREPYSQEDILEYLELCREQVDQQVSLLNLDAESGFRWLPFNELEL